MRPAILIRDETAADASAITEVTVAAFETLEISGHTEQYIVQALTVSLVAELEGRVVGHIAFSPVSISDGSRHWYGLGPVSVLPPYQRQGIGKALIHAGLARLQALGAQGCCLVGHPQYYRPVRLRERGRALGRGRAAGGVLRAVLRRAFAAGNRHLPCRFPGHGAAAACGGDGGAAPLRPGVHCAALSSVAPWAAQERVLHPTREGVPP